MFKSLLADSFNNDYRKKIVVKWWGYTGNETGDIPNALLIFKSCIKSANYHDYMNPKITSNG